MDGFVDDLRFAQERRKMVIVTLLDGSRYETGVHEFDVQAGFVSLYAPQYQGDLATQRVRLDDITGVTLTEIDYIVE